MRALLAILAATAILIAVLPTASAAAPPERTEAALTIANGAGGESNPERDLDVRVFADDSVDVDDRNATLDDDDVVHALAPLLGLADELGGTGDGLHHDGEGRIPLRQTRPPRAH